VHRLRSLRAILPERAGRHYRHLYHFQGKQGILDRFYMERFAAVSKHWRWTDA